MPRSPQTETAVLGALSVQPMTGYALRAAIVETLGHFWHESFGQIYPALARAEAAGHVRRATAGRTSGQAFELTDEGRERLRDLLREPADPTPPRNGLLLRLFFGAAIGPDDCLAMVREAGERAAGAAERLDALHAEVLDETDPGAPYRALTVEYGRAIARAQRDWAERAAAVLDGLRD